jgi:hypothetical protein
MLILICSPTYVSNWVWDITTLPRGGCRGGSVAQPAVQKASLARERGQIDIAVVSLDGGENERVTIRRNGAPELPGRRCYIETLEDLGTSVCDADGHQYLPERVLCRGDHQVQRVVVNAKIGGL